MPQLHLVEVFAPASAVPQHIVLQPCGVPVSTIRVACQGSQQRGTCLEPVGDVGIDSSDEFDTVIEDGDGLVWW